MVYKFNSGWKSSETLIENFIFNTYNGAILGDALAKIYHSYDEWYKNWTILNAQL
jgi:hypothetical protein